MAQQRFAALDSAHVHQHDMSIVAAGSGTSPVFSGPGTGIPYEFGVGNSPRIESGASGVLKAVQTVSLPATAIGANFDFTTIYPTSDPVNGLTILSYYGPGDASTALSGVANLYIQDIQVLSGAQLAGGTPPNSSAKINLVFSVGLSATWSYTGLVGTNQRLIGSFQGTANTPSSTRMLGGGFSFGTRLRLTGGVDGTSTVGISASTIRIVVLGYEI